MKYTRERLDDSRDLPGRWFERKESAVQEIVFRDLTALVRTNVVLGFAVAAIYGVFVVAGVRELVRHLQHRHV